MSNPEEFALKLEADKESCQHRADVNLQIEALAGSLSKAIARMRVLMAEDTDGKLGGDGSETDDNRFFESSDLTESMVGSIANELGGRVMDVLVPGWEQIAKAIQLKRMIESMMAGEFADEVDSMKPTIN